MQENQNEKPTAVELAEFVAFIKYKYPNIAKCIEIVETAVSVKIALHQQDFEKGGYTAALEPSTAEFGEQIVLKEAVRCHLLTDVSSKNLPHGISEIVDKHFKDLLLKIPTKTIT